MRFINEAIWDRIVSYSGGYLAGLLFFSLVYASVASGDGDNQLYMTILKTGSPLALLSVPAAYIVARAKGLLDSLHTGKGFILPAIFNRWRGYSFP